MKKTIMVCYSSKTTVITMATHTFKKMVDEMARIQRELRGGKATVIKDVLKDTKVTYVDLEKEVKKERKKGAR
jgi:hypothetical protein